MKKRLMVLLAALAIAIIVVNPVLAGGPDGPPGSPGWSFENPGQGGAVKPGPGGP